MTSRQLLITVSEAGFVVETMYARNGMDWSVLSRTFVETFPALVLLVADRLDRSDYVIRIRRAE